MIELDVPGLATLRNLINDSGWKVVINFSHIQEPLSQTVEFINRSAAVAFLFLELLIFISLFAASVFEENWMR